MCAAVLRRDILYICLKGGVQNKIIIPMEALYKMRKVVIAAACCAVLMCGCGSKKTEVKKDEVAKTEQVITTGAEDVTTDGHTTETFSIPSRETFAEIPAEAEQSFDCVIKTIDKTFPKAKKSTKRYYGYMGEQQVDGTLSYVFAIYDSKEGVQTPVATAAVTADNSRVYALDEDSEQFWLLEQYEPATEKAEFSWTVTAPVDEVTTDEE